MSGTRVTALDIASGESDWCEVTDDYVLICDGTARLVDVAVDGDTTVLTVVKGPWKSRQTIEQGGWRQR